MWRIEEYTVPVAGGETEGAGSSGVGVASERSAFACVAFVFAFAIALLVIGWASWPVAIVKAPPALLAPLESAAGGGANRAERGIEGRKQRGDRTTAPDDDGPSVKC